MDAQETVTSKLQQICAPVCVVCARQDSEQHLIKMRSDGIKTLTRVSLMRGDTALSQRLCGNPLIVFVHKACQLRYTRDGGITNIPSKSSFGLSKRLRSEGEKFDYRACCFLCCQPADERYREVHTTVINHTMLKMCELRNDEWGFEVLGRLKTCGDLHAAEARYHDSCQVLFIFYYIFT